MHIHRHSLLFGLSYALDIAGKNNLSHSKSVAYLSLMLGRELGLAEDEVLALYYAALLHDIGVSTEYKMYEHCAIGAEMLKKLPLPSIIPTHVLHHHEFYNGSGIGGLKGDEIPRGAQIIAFASAFDDIFGKKQGTLLDRALFQEVQGWVEQRKAFFAEDIRSAFARLMERESFLLDYFNYETKYAMAQKAVVNDPVAYAYEDVLPFALCFADIIDRRSPFTYSHSHGIAGYARKAAAHLGYDLDTQNAMYLAGLLHDIGKLHVSTEILHKNGPLDPEERFEINKHTYYTRKILEQIEGFEDITRYAANHHEKPDGTGYPYRMPGSSLSELERVMAACDVYQALTEERPYRSRMPEEKVWAIIGDMADKKHLDGELAERLKPVFAVSE